MSARRRTAAVATALVVLTVAAFLPVTRNGFILFDDPAYITRNPHVTAGLTREGLIWALNATAAGNWHPLTWLSHMLDVTLFGLDPAAHHLSSLLLHAVSTALLFVVLAAMTGRLWPGALVAALFAVHPSHVESVAWASERKDVLSGLFWVLTMGAYLRYVRRPGAGRYAAVAACLALGLLAKQMLVTMPFVLLLLDWWPLGRAGADLRAGPPAGAPSRMRLVAEKLPLLALSVGASVVTFVVQRDAGAVKGLELIPIVPRLFNAAVACVRYLANTLWPFHLSPYYPHLGPELSLGTILWSVGALLLATLAVRLAWRRRPWLATGWLWYLGTLLPVIGIVQVGWQSMADRYTYLPLIGVFIALAWEAAERVRGRAQRVAAAVALVLVVGLGALTWRQAGFWRDSVSVFARAAAVTPDNMMAQYYLGTALRIAGDLEGATAHLRAASRLNPRFPAIYTELGLTLSALGDLDGAIRAYERALQLEPDSATTHNNLGYALARLGRPERALEHYEAALRIKPRYPLARANAADALAALGRDAEAMEQLRLAAEDEAAP